MTFADLQVGDIIVDVKYNEYDIEQMELIIEVDQFNSQDWAQFVVLRCGAAHVTTFEFGKRMSKSIYTGLRIIRRGEVISQFGRF